MKIAPYLAHLRARNCSPKTLEDYEGDLRLFEEFLRERGFRVTQVKLQTISDFIEYLKHRHNYKTGTTGLAEASIRRRLASVSGFYDFLSATSDGKVGNPVRLLPKIRRSKPLPEVVPEQEIQHLLEGIDVLRDKALFSLFIASGLRLSELHQLNRDSIRVKERLLEGKHTTLGVGQVIGKGRKERVFLADLPTLEIVASYLLARGQDGADALFISGRGQRMSKRAIQERLHYWCGRLGLNRLRVHALRHAYATRLANAGIPGLVLQELMGHESFAVTQRYFRLKETRLSQEYFAAMELIRGEEGQV
ncbi:MAG: tyrosine-type recombinase/integrase [Acidobacteria bacterium]|nr:tyrosine-type recombinase/integrase [Acidobacteriota bacterium]